MTLPTLHQPTSPLAAPLALDLTPVAAYPAEVAGWFGAGRGIFVVCFDCGCAGDIFDGSSTRGRIGERWFGEEEGDDLCRRRFDVRMSAEEGVVGVGI